MQRRRPARAHEKSLEIFRPLKALAQPSWSVGQSVSQDAREGGKKRPEIGRSGEKALLASSARARISVQSYLNQVKHIIHLLGCLIMLARFRIRPPALVRFGAPFITILAR